MKQKNSQLPSWPTMLIPVGFGWYLLFEYDVLCPDRINHFLPFLPFIMSPVDHTSVTNQHFGWREINSIPRNICCKDQERKGLIRIKLGVVSNVLAWNAEYSFVIFVSSITICIKM